MSLITGYERLLMVSNGYQWLPMMFQLVKRKRLPFRVLAPQLMLDAAGKEDALRVRGHGTAHHLDLQLLGVPGTATICYGLGAEDQVGDSKSVINRFFACFIFFTCFKRYWLFSHWLMDL